MRRYWKIEAEQAAGVLGREKEPWEIPVGEYANRAAQRVSGQSAPKTRKLARTYHSLQVRQAIKEGRNVPPEVLKDYPHLVKTSLKSDRKQSVDEG